MQATFHCNFTVFTIIQAENAISNTFIEMQYFVKTPELLKQMFPGAVWDKKAAINNSNGEKSLYLTFDDGPEPEITPWVLRKLDEYRINATFFCIGKRMETNPELVTDIQVRGNVIGNHTYSHLNGWNTSKSVYLNDVSKCSEICETKLFRPPYGKIGLAQYRRLKQNYQVIMWDVLTGDFDASVSREKCVRNVVNNRLFSLM